MGVDFVFWGLFLALGAIVAGYLIWMHLVERSQRNAERSEREPDEPARGSTGHGRRDAPGRTHDERSRR